MLDLVSIVMISVAFLLRNTRIYFNNPNFADINSSSTTISLHCLHAQLVDGKSIKKKISVKPQSFYKCQIVDQNFPLLWTCEVAEGVNPV
jgi:hypothetical protein